MDSTDGVMVCALHIECSKVAARLCWYSCPFPLAFESGLFTSVYLQAGVTLLVLASVSVGVGVYSSSADKTTKTSMK